MWFFPLISCLAGAVFAGVLLRSYRATHNPACLAWAAALLLLSIASACTFAGSLGGWNSLLAKTYYLTGATVAVGFLALGMVFAWLPRLVAYVWLAVMLAITAAAIILLAGAGVDTVALSAADEPGWLAIDLPGALAAISGGTSSISVLILVLGSISGSVYQRLPWASTLVAAGAVIAGGTTAVASAVRYELGSVVMATGMVLIFVGAFKTVYFNRQD